MEQEEIAKAIRFNIYNEEGKVEIGLNKPQYSKVTGFIVGEGTYDANGKIKPVPTILVKVVLKTSNLNLREDPFEIVISDITHIHSVDNNGNIIESNKLNMSRQTHFK
jgi:hypothetical protein